LEDPVSSLQIGAASAATATVAAAGDRWALAAGIDERIPITTSLEVDAERAARRLDMWMDVGTFRGLAGSRPGLDERLTPLGIDLRQLADLLGERYEALDRRIAGRPWRDRLTTGYSLVLKGGDPTRDPKPPEELGFVRVVDPLLADAQDRLADTVDDLAGDDDLLGALRDVLCRGLPVVELSMALNRTMVLELNVARMEGRLSGSSPQERFVHFVGTLADPDTASAFLLEYPVLARYLVNVLDSWVATRALFARRLAQDLPEIRRTLWDGRDPGAVREVAFGAGDTHRGGQSVAIVTFEHERVVYKPRPLQADLAFGGYLDWFNSTRPVHRLRQARVLDRAGYGWAEYIAANGCQSDADVKAFYWRLGAQLALLYSLHAVDFHHENLIAAGADPVLVDLEALFHTNKTTAVIVMREAADPAMYALANSVSSVGLLPARIVVNPGEGAEVFAVDLSGIGGGNSQLTPVPVPSWEDAGTDVMHVVERHVEMDGANNRPRRVDEKSIDVREFQIDLIDGFTSAYTEICAAKDLLLAPGGVVDAFAEVPLRLVQRPTHLYARLLLDSLHPDFLRDGLDRDRCLARLCEGWDGFNHRHRMIGAEIGALRRGDIPTFEFRPSSKDLFLDDGTRVPDVLSEPPLQVVRERISRMNEEDRAQQLKVISGSFAALEMGEGGWPGFSLPCSAREVSADSLRAAALDIGRRLERSAFRDGAHVGWLGLSLLDETFWQLEPAANDTYAGLPGIGLFLSYLAAQTRDQRMADLAADVVGQVIHRSRAFLQSVAQVHAKAGPDAASLAGISIGAFGPVAGPVLYLAHASRLHHDIDCIAAAEELLPFIAQRIEKDENFDVIAGAAGCILALLALHEVAPHTEALSLARRAADRLLAGRVLVEEGCAWVTPMNPGQPLAGFSHGASGIAVALARLHAIAPDPAYPVAIRGALRFERHLYRGNGGNWPDLRETIGDDSMVAWCHGSSGIGLARVDLLRHSFLDEERVDLEAELREAAARVSAAGLLTEPVTGIGNHSICHGDLGNLELLFRVAGTAGIPIDESTLARVLNTVLSAGHDGRWLCGVPAGVETPGLMAGIAGIGYNLLRFADPRTVPSVLLLEAPPRSPSAGPGKSVP
jgi:type 2 lantibiotic biosynthesis protein LanM